MMHRTTDPDTFGFLVGDISRLIRAEMERRMGAANLPITLGEGRTLMNVAREGAMRQNVLAERMGLEAMTLSGYLDRLEARGLVVRETDPTDRRAKLVDLTDRAADVLAELRSISGAIHEDLAKTMTVSAWNDLNATLKRLRVELASMKPGAADRECNQ